MENGAQGRDFELVLNRSLTFVCAYHEERLVAFVNLAWDGGATMRSFWIRPCILSSGGVASVEACQAGGGGS